MAKLFPDNGINGTPFWIFPLLIIIGFEISNLLEYKIKSYLLTKVPKPSPISGSRFPITQSIWGFLKEVIIFFTQFEGKTQSLSLKIKIFPTEF